MNKKTVSAPSPNQVAWLLPATIFIHQLEEYYGQFPLWYSNLLNAQLSNQDFIYINAVGLFIFTAFSLSYIFNKNNIILVALGTLVFVNGIAHLLLSVFTFSYSPGTISGLVLFLPLGILIFNKILPKLNDHKKVLAIAIGIFVLFTVSFIAVNL
ncbi:MAG: HXXEE domain-containing protein [Saprospiraceae bacterium]|nr:HXXEE domain-containing protein [Saprospiraceae bacterium]